MHKAKNIFKNYNFCQLKLSIFFRTCNKKALLKIDLVKNKIFMSILNILNLTYSTLPNSS